MPEWTPRLEANVLLDFEGDLRDIAAYEAYGGYAQLRRAIEGMDAEGLIAELGGSALRGRGGAGFPTGRKASFLAPGAERYLVVNADESEPGSCKDRELLLRTPHALLEGILIVMNVLRLTRAYIYIRGEYLTESEVLEAAIAAGPREGLRRAARRPTAGRRRSPCTAARAPTSAARRRRCSRRSTASAASRARSRRSPPCRARSSGRRCSTTSRRSRRSPRSCAAAPRPTTRSAPSRAAART